MKKRFFIPVVLLIAIFSLYGEKVWVSTYQGRTNTETNKVEGIECNLINETKGNTTVEFRVNYYYINEIDINGKVHSKIIVPGASIFLEKGLPELPKFARSIIIPDEGVMNFRIVDVEYETKKTAPIIPSKGSLLRSIDPATVPYTWSDFYNRDEWFPENVIEISVPYILRDFRGITIRFNPFQYNPLKGELKVIKRAIVKVYKESSGGKNVLVRKKNTISTPFKEIYRNHFLNFETTLAKYTHLSDTVGNMLIITADAYYDNMADFIYWKRLKGIPVEIESVSVVGNTEADITNYIQNKYDTEGVTWVLLVGNATDVTPHDGTSGDAPGNAADPDYAWLAGSDNYPDAFISRFSANNATDVDNQVARSVNYERYPQDGGAWYHKACGIASDEGDPADSTRANWLRDTLLAYTYTHVDKIYQPSGTTSDITNAVNDGRSIINYIGHGNETEWQSVTFTTNDVDALSNTDMLPFVFSVACLVGAFDDVSECLMESWVWAGTPSAPKGGIASYGASISQSWVPPCDCQNHAMGLLKREEALTIGGMAFNGAMYMLDVHGSAELDMYETWHIFGDASIDLRTDIPDTLDVTHDSEVSPEPSTFTVTVKDNDGATEIEDALVCVWIYTQTPELHKAAYTDAAGSVSFDIDPDNVNDTMWITVTKHNYKPYEGYALVIDLGAPETPTVYRLFNYEKTPDTLPTFEFKSKDPQNDDVKFCLYWDTDNNFGSPDSEITGNYASDTKASYTLTTSLTQGSTYWWKVRAKDPAGSGHYSGWTGKRSFSVDTARENSSWFQTTAEQFEACDLSAVIIEGDSLVIALNKLDTLLQEGFEDATFPPTGWAKFEGPENGSSNDWARQTDEYHSGSASAGIKYDGSYTVDRFLATKKLNLKQVANTELVFWSRDNYASYYKYHGIWASTKSQTDTADYTEVTSIPATAEDTWEKRTIDLSAYDGSDSVFIAFRYKEKDGTDWWIDDVTITGDTKGDSGTAKSPSVAYIDFPDRDGWDKVKWTQATGSDSIRIQIEYLDAGTWALVPDDTLANNSTGFFTTTTTDSVDISGLDTTTYDTLRIKSTFIKKAAKAAADPSLLDWEVATTPTNATAVYLSSFTAYSVPEGVRLTWRMETEAGITRYEITRGSKDEVIGKVIAKGIPTPTNYVYTDKNPGRGKTNYWLKTVSSNGFNKVYGPYSVIAKGGLRYGMKVINSNLASKGIKILYTIPEKVNVNIRVYDITGRKVSELFNGEKEAGRYILKWNGTERTGIYFIRFKAGEYKKTERVIILK